MKRHNFLLFKEYSITANTEKIKEAYSSGGRKALDKALSEILQTKSDRRGKFDFTGKRTSLPFDLPRHKGLVLETILTHLYEEELL